ncbi:hypothetical protein AGR4B_Cc50015 [Agrobacterium tumefaciens str. CFBP 5621]|nr:hypothetical protein AGR4B_Cc50015 [Agrobacterium tumefaciens str. CFBP 5621]
MWAGAMDRHDGLPGLQRRFRQYVDHLFANCIPSAGYRRSDIRYSFARCPSNNGIGQC